MLPIAFHVEIPTYDNGIWTTSIYDDLEEFRTFIKSCFKEPGLYGFDETSFLFNEQARAFRKNGDVYCMHPFRSKDFTKYWDDEKIKCIQGVIFKNNGKVWYLPRDYYMWINFLQIYDKLKKEFDFATVWDVQLHIALYEFLAELHYLHAAIFKKRQIASQQPHSEPVITENGWSTIGKIKIGDLLWNPDGTLTKILHKTNNGLSDVYEFKFSDGRSTKCGIEHNWEVCDRWNHNKIKVLNTKQLLELGLYNSVTVQIKAGKKIYKAFRFGIKQIQPLSFKKQNLLIDPYVLGYLLGNGSFDSHSICVTSNDREVEDNFRKILGDKYLLVINGKTKDCNRHTITYVDRFNHPDEKHGINPLIRYVKKLGLKETTCYNKFIPQIYLHSSIEDRIALLQGLNDSDGFINSEGKDIHYTTVSPQLARNVEYLCRSLGISCIVNKKNKQKESHQDFYRIRMSGNIPFDIFRLKRKLDRQKLRKKGFELTNITSIEKLNYQEESSCIIVDNPNHLYITRDFIVTHNSYFHCAKIINRIWFDQGVILKMGAALKDYINLSGSWKFLDEYKSFLNGNTAWYRPMNPGKVLEWQQKIEVKQNGRSKDVGLKGMLQGMSFEQSATKGVGGPCSIFFYEEAGIAPTMEKTFEFIRPSLKLGEYTTGLFIAAGSVGELAAATTLKEMIYHPLENDIYPVETNLLDEHGTVGLTGLVIPEQWGMPPYIDEFGNSMVKEALQSLNDQYDILKKTLSPTKYQLRISQHPRNLKEGFAHRDESKFPIHLLEQQNREIGEHKYPYELLDIDETADGTIVVKKSNKLPIREFPVRKNLEDKEGVIVVWERPDKNPTWGTYIGSIDPVAEGKTITSESLCTIYIYKMPTHVKRHTDQGIENFIEGDKIVAAWCGRFDDINNTHKRLRLLIEWYQAWTLVENNVSLFIQYMITERKQKFLVPKSQILFLKEIEANKSVFQEYGWRNTGTMFRVHLLNYLIEFLNEVVEEEIDDDGTIKKKFHGVRRIPDVMAIVEMLAYRDGLNVDRMVALAALIAFITIQLSNTERPTRTENDMQENLENSKNLYKLDRSTFRNLGRLGKNYNGQTKPRSPFKHRT